MSSESNDLRGIFATDDDKKQLKDAILECTRDEVHRVLFDLFRRQNATNPSCHQQTNTQPAANINSRRHTTRSCTKPRHLSTLLQSSPLLQQQHSPARSLSLRPVRVPLEVAVPIESANSKIHRSTSAILEKSVDIVTRATGHKPTKFSLHDDKSHQDDKDDSSSADMINVEAASKDYEIGLQQVESWPVLTRPKSLVSFRPSETTRLMQTSPQSITNKNARPATTALERRSSWVSTTAAERSKAVGLGKRLLGPISAESKLANYSMVLPTSLQVYEWENELARNIINVFSNKVRSDIKQCDESVDYIPPATATSSTRISSSRAFFENDEESSSDVEDFQRISISRGGQSFSCFDVSDNTVVGRSDTDVVPKASQAIQSRRKGRMSANGALRLRMIWLTGTSAISNWKIIDGSLTDIAIDIDELNILEERGNYMKCIRLLESSIVDMISRTTREEHQDTWRQLVITANGFAIKCTEQRKPSKAMELIDKSLSLIDSEVGLLPESTRKELIAAVKETQAYYYIRRAKPSASLQYIISAINLHKTNNSSTKYFNIARCRLHEAFIQNRLNKYDKSMQCLERILSMVERGVLEVSDDKQHTLLLVSICYHNIAVQQLMTGHVSDACIASQNARRIARLCLSVSSHFLPTLESTHKKSLNQLSQMMQNNHDDEQTQQTNLFHGLITELFD